MGGRRKKKGLTQKIKETLTGGSGKHKDHEQSQTMTYAAKTSVTSGTTTAGQHHVDQHEKKSVMEKIKEKLPGGHHSH